MKAEVLDKLLSGELRIVYVVASSAFGRCHSNLAPVTSWFKSIPCKFGLSFQGCDLTVLDRETAACVLNGIHSATIDTHYKSSRSARIPNPTLVFLSLSLSPSNSLIGVMTIPPGFVVKYVWHHIYKGRRSC